MALGPPKPAIGVPNKDLSQVDHLMGDPADGERANHRITHLHIAALWQRLGRIPYAPKSNVAMQLQGNPETKLLHRGASHTGTLKSQLLISSLRYPAHSNSKPLISSGLLTPQWSRISTYALLTNSRRPAYVGYRLSIPAVSNLFQSRYDLDQPFVDEIQGPPESYEGDNKHPEVPGCHNSLRRCGCDRHLGIPGRVGFLHAIGVRSQGNGYSNNSKAPAIAVHLLALRIRERCLLTNAPIQHNDARNYSENSDFHFTDTPKTRGSLTVAPFFLAASRVTGTNHRSTQAMFLVALQLEAPMPTDAPRIPRDRSLTFGQMVAMVVTVGIVIYGASYLLMRWIWL